MFILHVLSYFTSFVDKRKKKIQLADKIFMICIMIEMNLLHSYYSSCLDYLIEYTINIKKKLRHLIALNTIYTKSELVLINQDLIRYINFKIAKFTWNVCNSFTYVPL